MSNKITTSKHRLVSYINSTFLFLLAFIVVYWINIFTTVFVSSLWDIETTIRNFRVEFLIGPQSNKWNIDSIVIIFLSAPFVSLTLAGLFSRFRLIFRGERSYLNLFLIWAYFHSMSFSLGAFVSGVVSKDVIWYALAWIGIPLILQYLVALILIIVLYYIGYTTSVFFFESCIYPSPSNKYNRQSWLLNAGLKPWITGYVLLVLAFIPDIREYELYILFTTLIMIIPLFRSSKLIPDVYVYEEVDKPDVFWKHGIIGLALILFLRFSSFIF